jgi:cytochrome c-type biogenesis protein
MDFSALVYSFTLGTLAAFNPCGFAMLPAYVSYFLATEEGDGLASAETPLGRLGRALLVGLTLTSGFLLLFSVAGGIISAGGYALVSSVPWAGVLLGVFFFFMGLWMFSGRYFNLPFLPQVQLKRSRNLRGVFLFGAAYGLVSLSCTLPLFMSVIGGALTQDGVASGSAQFVAYGLGMGVMLVLVSVSLALFEGVLVTRMRQASQYVSKLGALVLIGVGIYMIYYWGEALWLMQL